MTSEELFDVVDENDCVVAVMTRREVHRQKLLHRAVHIFVFRDDGRMLIHFRHPDKEEFPSVWTSSASGHVSTGETYRQSAERELTEELGISAPIEFAARVAACPETSHEFTELFVARSSDEIRFDPNEITDIRWVTLDEVRNEVNERPELFSPAFIVLLTAFLGVPSKGVS
ncbi:MAG: NUDIX domain-containing protein [Planctomycetaceae bacterium]|nr:NUDIX domain-containing protein [Planctomycetaceae bacterium]